MGSFSEIRSPSMVTGMARFGSASKYEAVLTTPEHWIDLVDGQDATTEEIAAAAVDVFEEHIGAAGR